MKLKKCLLTFLIGFSLLFSGLLISCGDTPDSNEDLNNTEQTNPDEESKKDDDKKTEDKKSDDDSTSDDTRKDDSKKTDEQKPDEKSDEETKPAEYTVTFSVDGGSSVESQKVKSGEKATKPAKDPTKDYYDFDGWYSDSAKTKTFDFNTAITAATTIYAKWKLKAGLCIVTFNSNGGSEVDTAYPQSGTKVTKPANPTKENYRFDGWYSDSALTTAFDFNTTVSQTITLYAKWIAQGTASIGLTQESAEGITKSATGYTFTAPAGYVNYEWKIKGSAIGEGNLTPDNESKTVCTISSSYWGSKLAKGAEYTIEVKAYNASNELCKIYHYPLVIEEDL